MTFHISRLAANSDKVTSLQILIKFPALLYPKKTNKLVLECHLLLLNTTIADNVVSILIIENVLMFFFSCRHEYEHSPIYLRRPVEKY